MGQFTVQHVLGAFSSDHWTYNLRTHYTVLESSSFTTTLLTSHTLAVRLYPLYLHLVFLFKHDTKYILIRSRHEVGNDVGQGYILTFL